jgi:hypothetical protein
VPAELKNMLQYKEELLTDTKNLLYHRSDDVELLAKQLEDADQQLVQCMQSIKSMAEEKELRQKQLEDLQEATQVVVNIVDPLEEEGVVNNRTLLEHLCEAPQKTASYVFETTKTYVVHVLGLVKSFWPKANVEPLADGMAADYSEEEFRDNRDLVFNKVVAELPRCNEYCVEKFLNWWVIGL